MRQYSIILLLYWQSVFLSSCGKPSPEMMAVNVLSIDSLAVIDPQNVFVRLKVISPLPESLFIARPDVKHYVEGGIPTIAVKYQTLLPDSLKSNAGEYEVFFTGYSSFAGKAAVRKFRYWKDDHSTIDTMVTMF